MYGTAVTFGARENERLGPGCAADAGKPKDNCCDCMSTYVYNLTVGFCLLFLVFLFIGFEAYLSVSVGLTLALVI